MTKHSIILLITTLIFNFSCIESKNLVVKEEKQIASFTTIFDINSATKDGFYVNGYVVLIDYSEAQKLDGKKIEIKGEVTIVKGLESEKDSNGKEIFSQGRKEDTKQILQPKIRIL